MPPLERIYLDYAATTPINAEVLDVLLLHSKESFGNASSVHSFGRTSKVILEESRELIARSINAEPGEIVFTSGGTEADNHALIGAALARRRNSGKNHILISSVEHHAVLECAEYLSECGFVISQIPVDTAGRVHLNEVENLLRSDTAIVSVMHGNNEVGTLQPIEEISALCKSKNILFHTDTVQTFGKIPVDVKQLGIDFAVFSSHKIYGPKGIGALYIRNGVEIDSLIHGGAQERNHRAGTENIPSLAGFALAVKKSVDVMPELQKHLKKCKTMMTAMLQSQIEGLQINGGAELSLPSILSVSLDHSIYDIESETLLLQLDLHGVAASSGSACTSGSIQPSHVLQAMGKDAKTAKSTVRFSFGKNTTVEEIETASKIFIEIVSALPKK
ncbi:MAG: cysteine desulfurase [Bacteroidetes bacterium]|nr:cysteine desulfurase [Bacteroidota bacterium]